MVFFVCLEIALSRLRLSKDVGERLLRLTSALVEGRDALYSDD